MARIIHRRIFQRLLRLFQLRQHIIDLPLSGCRVVLQCLGFRHDLLQRVPAVLSIVGLHQIQLHSLDRVIQIRKVDRTALAVGHRINSGFQRRMRVVHIERGGEVGAVHRHRIFQCLGIRGDLLGGRLFRRLHRLAHQRVQVLLLVVDIGHIHHTRLADRHGVAVRFAQLADPIRIFLGNIAAAFIANRILQVKVDIDLADIVPLHDTAAVGNRSIQRNRYADRLATVGGGELHTRTIAKRVLSIQHRRDEIPTGVVLVVFRTVRVTGHARLAGRTQFDGQTFPRILRCKRVVIFRIFLVQTQRHLQIILAAFALGIQPRAIHLFPVAAKRFVFAQNVVV